MDSITQACVGAVVGELFLGKRLGWRAPLWGACVGTIPDLDVLANPWLELHEQVRWHRGWSHGLLGLLLGTGIGSSWLAWRHKIEWKTALLVSGVIMFFTILVDCFNAYGTQIYEPFSDHRIAWNLLFVIDPLFTFPLIASIIVGRYLHWKQMKNVAHWMLGGIGLSALYILIAICLKVNVNDKFESSLSEQAYTVQHWYSAPTPFNTLYWRSVAAVEGGYLIGYACPWDDPQDIPWVFIAHHHELLAERLQTPGMQTVLWSSFGYWIADINDAGETVLTDIRFGDAWLGRPGHSQQARLGVWQFTLTDDGMLERIRPHVRDFDAALSFLWQRITARAQSGT